MGGGSDLKRLSGNQNLLLGMVSGCGSKLINYPLLVWKNASQQGLKLEMNPKKLYRGLPVGMLNLGGTTAVQFWATGFFQKMISSEGEQITASQKMQAAFLGGIASGIPCSLWELTMIQQQRFGGSILGANMRIIKEHGIMAIGRGSIMTMGRESMYTMAMLGVAPSIQSELVSRFNLNGNLGLAVGALSGSFFSATITHPMDTIKTCMQGDVEQKKYKGIVQTGRLLAEEYGVAQGLFKGLLWRITLITTTFFLVNKFKQTLAPVMFPVVDEEE
tara:strand:+ start:225 stop:1049 length:825 start_codon:yes stop_codon:yes gene_type:complete